MKGQHQFPASIHMSAHKWIRDSADFSDFLEPYNVRGNFIDIYVFSNIYGGSTVLRLR